MREYKPTYCVSLLYGWGIMFLCCIPAMLFAAVMVDVEGSATFWQVFLGFISAMTVCSVVFFILAMLISKLIGLFVRKTVELTETSVSYEGKTIPLDKIRYITLYLPVFSKTSSKPQFLTLWADTTTYMDIKRPSLALVAALKKRCRFASFDVDDWKGHLKQCLWIQLGIVAVFLLGFLFG